MTAMSLAPTSHVQASWENYHRRRDEIVKDCNPPDREAQLGAATLHRPHVHFRGKMDGFHFGLIKKWGMLVKNPGTFEENDNFRHD